MSAPDRLLREIARFYHRWHALEATLGADNGNVLDFDFCPREALHDLEKPYDSRLEALRALESLRGQLAVAQAASFANHTYLAHKLTGSAAFLRALMGERRPFADYLYATMGIYPEPVSIHALQKMRAELEAHFGRLNVPFTPAGREAYQRLMVMSDLTHFETRLREQAALWIGRIEDRVGLQAKPIFTLEVVREDAYWANWVDGAVDRGIRLRVNLHPRITYHQGAELGLAVHEIGGHALHVLEMYRACREGRIDVPSLNLTVHSCEAFQMEGLAQGVMQLLAEDGEIPEMLALDLQLKQYHLALLNNAQLELESGKGIDHVVDEVLTAGPFLRPLKVLSDLRDRMRHPLFRCYIFVYAPSRHRFLSALSLPVAQRREFLRRMYTGLYTPDQIKAELKSLAAAALHSGA